jgi:glyoxylase-like metal-dependent hydrolase (beta-lactamase superfamily II)
MSLVPGVVRQVTPRAAVLLAPNPSPMTLDGTNTWLLREPGSADLLVVDPGPLDEGHLTAVAGQGRVALIALTHGHPDHAEGAARLAELTGADVVALDPSRTTPGAQPLRDGETVRAAGVALRVLATPGHTADSLSFLLEADDAVLTGDTVLGRGTTVVAHPDGVLGDYLDSLRRLRELGGATVLPGHGPELPSAGTAAERYLAHREQRLEQVRAAVAAGARTPADVLAVVYADVDRALWPAAELSVRAQLAHLGLP